MKFSSIQKTGESVLMNSLVTACNIFICISSNQSGCKIQSWGAAMLPLQRSVSGTTLKLPWLQ